MVAEKNKKESKTISQGTTVEVWVKDSGVLDQGAAGREGNEWIRDRFWGVESMVFTDGLRER